MLNIFMEIVGRHSYNQLAKFQIGNRKVQNVSIYFLYLTSLPTSSQYLSTGFSPDIHFNQVPNFKESPEYKIKLTPVWYT